MENILKALASFMDYEKVKDHLIVRLRNTERDAELLSIAPHRIIGDIALTYAIRVADEEGKDVVITVTDEILRTLGVSQDTLENDAFTSFMAHRPAHVESLPAMIFGLTNGAINDDAARDVLVVTNEQTMYGASVLFSPGMLEKLSETYKEFYALPSSVHEWLILPAGFGFEPEALAQMVREVNSQHVDGPDFLSDHVYRYNEEGFTIAA